MKLSYAITLLIFLTQLPLTSVAQRFTSDLQLDKTLSGNMKTGEANAILHLSVKEGLLSIKFQELKDEVRFKIQHIGDTKNDDHLQTMYEIVDDMNYGALKVSRFYSPLTVRGKDYPVSLTIIGSGTKGIYYTTFYAVEE